MIEVLVVEDDQTILDGIAFLLEKEGYHVDTAKSFINAINAIERKYYDLAILDLGLPDGNGYDLCERLKKKHGSNVIFLTARDEEKDIVKGLDMGGDDYITKPFRVAELVSRIKAVLRRNSGQEKVLSLQDLIIYSLKGKVYRNHQEIFLSAMEYRLLLTFAANKNQILTRDQLLSNIWDISDDLVNDNTLTVYIKRLREKIEKDPQNPRIIQTIRGLGYIGKDI
ncbi:MAG: response regulator transcription factor [Erysipelotrichaceae bacterium]